MKLLKCFSCMCAGIGVFLPFISMTLLGQTESFSFFKYSNHGKIILGVVVIIFIISIIQLFKDSFPIKILGLILIDGATVYYISDISAIAVIKNGLSMIKYGAGYYLTLIGLLFTFILELINIFKDGGSYEYAEEYDFNSINTQQVVASQQANSQYINPLQRGQSILNQNSPSPTTLNNPMPNQINQQINSSQQTISTTNNINPLQ